MLVGRPEMDVMLRTYVSIYCQMCCTTELTLISYTQEELLYWPHPYSQKPTMKIEVINEPMSHHTDGWDWLYMHNFEDHSKDFKHYFVTFI